MRNPERRRSHPRWAFSLLAAALGVVLCVGDLRAQTLPGDCDNNDEVSVNEIVMGINVALGMESLDICRAVDENGDGIVSIDEIVRSIREALGIVILINGDCVRPGPQGTPPPGLVACESGAPVRLLRCEQRDQCLHDPNALSVRDEEAIESDGEFSLSANSNETRGATLVSDAEVDEEHNTYRTMGFGSIAAFATGVGRGAGIGAAAPADANLSPMSEAAVRMIDENGLENYVDAGIPLIVAAVVAASADTNFAGLAPEDAVGLALDNARSDENVDDHLKSNRRLVRNVRYASELRPAGDIDLYGFSLSEAAEIMLEVSVVEGNIVPCLELRSAANELLAGPQCGSPAQLTQSLDRGNYVVLVSDPTGTGTYDILLTEAAPPTVTVTQSPTATPTVGTPAPTVTPTATATVTPTSSETETSTPSRTATVTPTETASATSTSTPSSTPTPTATLTPGTFDVDSTADTDDVDPGDGACVDAGGFCTLRAAVQEALALGLPYVIHLPAGVYTLTSGIPLTLQGQLSLAGAGRDEAIIQAADEPNATNFGIFDIPSGMVEISSVTLRNGRHVGFGGALQVGNTAVVTLKESFVRQNVDAVVSSGTLMIVDSDVEVEGDLDYGDAVRNFGTLVFLRSTVSPGGGLSSGIFNAGDLTFADSEARDGLDGIYNELLATATLTDSVLHDNTFGIRNLGVATLQRCVVENNTTLAGDAGAGVTSSGVLSMEDTVVQGNTASDGAGLLNTGTALLRRCTVSGNETSGVGGSGSGGGIWNTGMLMLVNSTVSDNQALTGQGGAIWNTDSGSVTLRNATLAGNMADIGGGISVTSGVAQLANTIIATNAAADAPDCGGAPTSQGFNLIGDGSGCDVVSSEGDMIGTGESPIDPLLGLLADNGGLTPTRALLFGSPAIEAGNPAVPGSGGNACEVADQRGVARPQGATCDIGSYEAPALKP